MARTLPPADTQAIAPLARLIAETIRDTPVRLGSPEGAGDLAATLTVKVAAYMGRELPSTPGLATLMVELDTERQAQLAKFGDQKHPDGTAITEDRDRADRARHVCESMARLGQLSWRDVLHEEVQEAFAEADPARLRAELVQVAAVCAAWIWDIDQRPASA
ncbi:NUDIX hydrolase [Streptomyces sp. NPDC057235]|uniref:NUDIX hydrolase n=1 Tax=Streptomyces sp. NPDC057235 TaxID=3346058 RepID=UPI003629F3F6